MGIIYDSLMKGLNEALEYEKGNLELPTKILTTERNKYNLKPSDINKLVILDRTQIENNPMFWRNNAIQAYCILREFGSPRDFRFSTENSVWIGIYDEDAKAYRNKVRYSCTSYGGMCGYTFKTFFNPKEIDNNNDLNAQIFLLETINSLIDKGILGLPKEENKEEKVK